MPKVLQINSVLNTGSTGRIVEQLGIFIQNHGWESIVAYGRSNNESSLKALKIGTPIDVILHGFRTRIFDQHGLGSRRATKKIIKEIKNIKPDIIHIHNIHGYYVNYVELFNFFSSTNIPIVWTLHDCWAFTGHCAYFSIVKCEKWKDTCGNCPKKRKAYPFSIIDNSKNNHKNKKRYFNSLDKLTIVTVSHWLKILVQESFLNKNNIKVIHNGIDLNIFYPKLKYRLIKKYNFPSKRILLGVATSWGNSKGLMDYYALSEVLPDQYQIVLVGLTQKQLKNLPSEIIGIKRTENVEELVELYSMAHIVLSLSYQETFGLTPVEGFACGTPAIGYNCTATPELITQDTGLIIEPGRIDLLLESIKLITAKGKAFYSQKCRERAEKYFNKNKQFEIYLSLYKKLLDGIN